MEIALAMETATRDTLELQEGTQKENKVHKIVRHQDEVDRQCYRCGSKDHNSNRCRFRNATCYNCGKQGHIRPVCKSKLSSKDAEGASQRNRRNNDKNVRALHEEDHDEYKDVGSLKLHDLGTSKDDVIWVTPKIEDKEIKMELDTGAAVSVIPWSTFREHYQERLLKRTKVQLKTYSGEKITPRGVAQVKVTYNQQEKQLPLYVVETRGPALFGRDWLKEIALDWKNIRVLNKARGVSNTPITVTDLRKKYADVFEGQLGKLTSRKARITLKEGATPKFCKARQVPYALKPKVEEAIRDLENKGVLTKTEWSEWATPVVPVLKSDGSVRLCGDFKVTVNPQIQAEQYPLPRIEDLFANLAGGQKFSKIDLKQAYHQMELEEESKKFLTINTHMGLFQYNRLVFGITSAPAIWQQTMDQLVGDIPNTTCLIDDILITGPTEGKHMENLEKVLKQLSVHGLRANPQKCAFLQDKIEFCGHEIDAQGLHKKKDKVEAILKAPRPKDVKEVRSFLGLVNYYNKFLPNLATVIQPLNQLLEQGTEWEWSKDCERAFLKAKEMITSNQVLTHYDPKLPLRLACDASPVGIGAVLSHVFKDGTERPIAFASRSLRKAERNYSQIDKEALALVWGVKKFHAYLFGRTFQLYTDHQPLTSIFHPGRGIPAMTAARLQRYALFLSGFNYTIEYKNTKAHGNADGLSRLPLQEAEDVNEDDAIDPVTVLQLTQFEPLPVTTEDVKKETRRDPLLSRVREYTETGWPTQYPPELAAFHVRQSELTIQDGCLLWGNRVIIPSKLRDKVLEELHEGHLGIGKMKGVARTLIWWPTLDKQIETLAKGCSGCQLIQNEPPITRLHPWEWPNGPWQRIHVDFAGPFLNRMFLIVVDAYSKWPEVEVMQSTTTEKTIEKLRQIFGRYGVPQTLVSDNRPQFTAHIFQEFLKRNGIKHITSAPYHPATNGLAERFVQSFKKAMKKEQVKTNLNHKLANFMLSYRNAPHATTGESPAQLFFGRRLRSRLDLMKPDPRAKVHSRQEQQGGGREKERRELQIGKKVVVRVYQSPEKWKPGVVVARTGALHYEVEVAPGLVWRRHIDQLKESDITSSPQEGVEWQNLIPNPVQPTETVVIPQEKSMPTNPTEGLTPSMEDTEVRDSTTQASCPSTPCQVESQNRRYPVRSRRPPDRLNL
ncbi:uncharacterized protein K02A2.6-like [Actinia tenebrosa]|uniref:Uncharacterized protein K02A2.6-like n=1 Tax=Actinia tenebrosa TaxID=6105 RepID=A0A6P8IWR5_ACTTE|nr:uncharacterized protein K02A2.6-like [Actinia tenebrosa]